MTSLGQKGPEFVPVCTNSDKKIKINNHTIFEESNSFLKSVFENYNVLMPPHPLLPCCDVINRKFESFDLILR